MKKLQIMAWVLSALLLTGCGGSGTPTNTDNLPQTSATDASETTTTQNGNEYASEEAMPGQDEKSGASDAAPGQVTEKDSSAGDEKPAVGKTPAQENGASAPSKAGPAGGESSDSAGSSSSKPAGNSPSVPAGNESSTPAGSGTDAAETPAPQPEEKGFDIDYHAHAEHHGAAVLPAVCGGFCRRQRRCSGRSGEHLDGSVRANQVGGQQGGFSRY